MADAPTIKEPSAVVLIRRGPMVLALTRGPHAFHDWHLPGGKWEPWDGWWNDDRAYPATDATAARELREETGIVLRPDDFASLVIYVSRSGRPVHAYEPFGALDLPERFAPTDAGQPAWVPPGMLTLPWCTFADECSRVLAAADLLPSEDEP